MQPCRILVRPLLNVTMLTASVSRSSGKLAPSTPSVTGRLVISPMVKTAGMVSPMVASTEPSKMFTERWS